MSFHPALACVGRQLVWRLNTLVIFSFFSVIFFTIHSAFAEEPNLDRQTIIDSLKPKPVAKTRSLRNLTVEKSEAPSISLTIQFEFDSAEVSQLSRSQLDVLADAMNSEDLADYSFKIEGHTDAKGSGDYNLKLSERRAAAVREVLDSKGVSKSRLVTLGKGSSELLNRQDPFAAENRRVKFITVEN